MLELSEHAMTTQGYGYTHTQTHTHQVIFKTHNYEIKGKTRNACKNRCKMPACVHNMLMYMYTRWGKFSIAAAYLNSWKRVGLERKQKHNRKRLIPENKYKLR